MRILKVVRDMHPREGGPPRVVAGAAVALAALGHEVTIAATYRPGEEAAVRAAWPALAEAQVTLRLFPLGTPAVLGGSAALTRFMAETMASYDVAHLHGVWDGCLIATGRAARRRGKPYFISPHGMLDRWSMAQSRWKKRAVLHLAGGRTVLDGAAGVVFGTSDEAQEATSLRLESGSMIVPNGVDPDLLAEPAPGAAAALHARQPGTAAWTRTTLFYSRFHPKKGLDLLIAAFARVAGDFPGAGLLAAGIPQDEAYVAALRTQVSATGLDDRIIVATDMIGPDSRFLLDAVDIFALPSHQEGFSIAILEAMGRGLPVLITDRCHLPEIETGHAGRVVAADVDGFEAGLRDLLARDDQSLRAMGKAGRALVAEKYVWPQIARRLVALYNEAMHR